VRITKDTHDEALENNVSLHGAPEAQVDGAVEGGEVGHPRQLEGRVLDVVHGEHERSDVRKVGGANCRGAERVLAT